MPQSKTIVVVDDDELTLHLLTRILKSEGYRVLTSLTGQEGLQLIRDKKPDFIIMDILLPDRDGPEVIWALQSNPHLARIPVVFLSSIIAHNENRSLSQIKVRDITYDAIGKPVDQEILLQKIREALDGEAL